MLAALVFFVFVTSETFFQAETLVHFLDLWDTNWLLNRLKLPLTKSEASRHWRLTSRAFGVLNNLKAF